MKIYRVFTVWYNREDNLRDCIDKDDFFLSKADAESCYETILNTERDEEAPKDDLPAEFFDGFGVDGSWSECCRTHNSYRNAKILRGNILIPRDRYDCWKAIYFWEMEIN